MTAHVQSLVVSRGTEFEAYPPISIIGLGYVGAVSAACFAQMAHKVVGVDTDERKRSSINAGKAPLVEAGLNELTGEVVASDRLKATGNIAEAVAQTEITFVCVGTPSCEDGSVDLTALKCVAEELGRALAQKSGSHTVVIRSTVPVGTTRNVVLPILESASGKTCGRDFGLAFHPEFLREGVAIADFFAPPKTVVGGFDEGSSDVVAALYGAIDAPLIKTSIEVAEMVKYVDNTWHAVKVSFANEIGKICQASEVDSHDVMGIFVQDLKLNLSPYYMRPGFAFGGSCLPKDVRALRSLAHSHKVSVPLIESIIPSNDAHVDHAVQLIAQAGATKIGFLGITFKPGTDDMRESPYVDLMGRLLAKGYEIKAYDSNVTLQGLKLAGVHAKTASKTTAHALATLPEKLADSTGEVTGWADLIVVCHNTSDFHEAVRGNGELAVLDLARLPSDMRGTPEYTGICW